MPSLILFMCPCVKYHQLMLCQWNKITHFECDLTHYTPMTQFYILKVKSDIHVEVKHESSISHYRIMEIIKIYTPMFEKTQLKCPLGLPNGS